MTALDLGAVDYVTKPFDTDELLARVRAALRQRLASEADRQLVEAGDVRIDLFHRTVSRSGEEVHLTPKEYAILAELAKNPGRVLTHTHLLRSAWAPVQEGKPNICASPWADCGRSSNAIHPGRDSSSTNQPWVIGSSLAEWQQCVAAAIQLESRQTAAIALNLSPSRAKCSHPKPPKKRPFNTLSESTRTGHPFILRGRI